MTDSEFDFRGLSVAEMEARLAAFEARVNDAQAANAPTREWVKDAIHRRGTGRCPVRLKRLSTDLVLRYGDALADLFCAYPDDMIAAIPYDITIGYQAPGKTPWVNPVEALMRDAQWKDEWGTRWGHAFGGVGATPIEEPIKDWAQLDAYLAEGIPNPHAPGRFDAIRPLMERHRTKYRYGIIHLAMFERLHSLRGMQNLLTDFYTNENEVRRLMEALEAYLIEIIRAWGDMGADGVFMTDDWGSQTGLFIAPDLWRHFFKACYTRIFAEVHRFGMDVLFHSCGNVTGIVGDLIEAGMDVLDPVQPGAMDIDRLAREFGGRTAFSGAIDIQHLLCDGTPAQIKDEVRRIIDTLGRPFGGSLLIGPANVMTPETPLANLHALFEASHAQ